MHIPDGFLIATLDLDLALELCDRTIVVGRGEVVYDGETERVLSDPDLLSQHALELPLSDSRPYCQIEYAPELQLLKPSHMH